MKNSYQFDAASGKRARGAGLAAATLLAVWACSAPAVRAAGVAHVEYRGAITALVPRHHPLIEVIPPPPLVLDPAFAARFAPGQAVVLKMAYLLDAENDFLVPHLGRYAVDAVGSIAVDGLTFPLGPSVITLENDSPNSPQEQFHYYANLNQSGVDPVIFGNLTLVAALYGDDIIDSVAQGPPPTAYEASVGELAFGTGLVRQALEFSIDSVVASVGTQAAGDFDLNGVVDGGDYLHWRGSFGNIGRTRWNADGDADGDVDGDDFLIWQRGLGGGATVAATAIVPEPGAMVLLACALAMAFRRTQVSGRLTSTGCDERKNLPEESV